MIKLILNNVLKHRFLYSLMGILFFLLSFYLVVGVNLLKSVDDSLVSAVRENMSGDVIVVPRENEKIDLITKDGEKKVYPMRDWKELQTFLTSRTDVVVATPRLRVWGSLKTDLNSIPMILVGVDPKTEFDLLPSRTVDEGEWIESGRQIALYFRHSDYLSASLSDSIGVSTTTVDGYQNLDVAELKTILDYKELESYTDLALLAYVPLNFLQELRQDPEETVGELVVRLTSSDRAASLIREIEKAYPGRYRTVLPEQSSALVFGVSSLVRFCVSIVGAILFAMVVLCSGFLVNITLENRRTEIGIYQALGIRNSVLGLSIGSEFLFVIVVFGTLGIFGGNALLAWAFSDGIVATITPLKLILGRQVVQVEPSFVSNVSVLGILLLAFVGNLLFSLRKLDKLDPVDVLREA